MVSVPNLNAGIGIPSGAPAIDGGEPVREKGRFLVFTARPWSGPGRNRRGDRGTGAAAGSGPGRTTPHEAEFAAYLGLRGRRGGQFRDAALHLVAAGAGRRPGDEVITTAILCATVNVICHVGATPVSCDCDRATQCILPVEIERRITRTKAIIVVHMCGRLREMNAIMAIAEGHGIPVIEDCAHAIETRIGERPVGTYGTYACYSFYATKNLTTSEGGMVLAQARSGATYLYSHSQPAWAELRRLGAIPTPASSATTPSSPAEVQPHRHCAGDGARAAPRDREPPRAPPRHRRTVRRRICQPAADPAAAGRPDTRLAYHLYTVQVDEKCTGISRNDLLVALRAENIGVGVHYEAVHTLAFYHSLLGLEPKTRRTPLRTKTPLFLPLSTAMTDEDVADADSWRCGRS